MENGDEELLKEQIRLQELEIEFLRKRLESSESGENRLKILKLETLNEARSHYTKRIGISAAIVALLLSFLGFLGFENIKSSILSQIEIEPLKKSVLIAAKKEIQDIENTKSRVLKHEKEIKQIHDKVALLGQSVEETRLESETIITALSPEIKSRIDNTLRSKYFEFSGVSSELLVSVLQIETQFDIESYDYSDLRLSVRILQKKIGLEPDGQIGPATSLMVMVLAVKNSELEALDYIKKNIRRPVLREFGYSFSYYDKESIIQIIENRNHPLHSSMMKVLKITDGIHDVSEAEQSIRQFFY